MDISSMLMKRDMSNEDAKKIIGPRIIFKDMQLYPCIAQWMGIDAKGRFKGGRSTLTSRQYTEIKSDFAKLLGQIGIPDNETCFIDNFNSEDFSFNCRFKNRNDNVKISLCYSTTDDLATLEISGDNLSLLYDLYGAQKNSPRRLELISFKTKNPENGNVVYSSMLFCITNFVVSNDSHLLEIKVLKQAANVLENNTFRLKDDISLVQYLMGLAFPVEADKVYKEVCKHLDENIVYSLVEVDVVKTKENGEKYTTDDIVVKKGKLSNFILTRNGKKVGFDCEGNTIYEEKNVAVNMNKDGGVDYHFSFESKDKMDESVDLNECITLAHEGIEEIRTLAKTITSSDLGDGKNE